MMTKIYNLITWAVTFVAIMMALLHDEMFFHGTMVLLLVCVIRFWGNGRIFMGFGAVCACGIMFPSVIFLIAGVEDFIPHTVIIATALLHAVPMFRFVVSGHKKLLYSGF